ncbi:MAG: hypothetical protein J0I77_15890 [Rudaea sp.]|uniref:hypothetical protein n=1 Tax=unclassified Rudaea TaxID=2627037 RepID=UPI0010F51694|nr:MULTISPECIES: hypothetical protein [unclassified Rudaea]MBN8887205.1 hypothetical protein [Rudaea sp.]MBR0347410.1 hypothetical protein [Rudaea sp.]
MNPLRAQDRGRLNAAYAVFAALAGMLLILTLLWHIPMMLWDQLDMVPIYQAWRDGTLGSTEFFSFRAGHVHLAAYAVLLATTHLTHGQLWLDCAVSWVFLVVYAVLVVMQMRRTLPTQDRFAQAIFFAMIFLVLYPGHLANLQWGWQVAVFMSLVGTVVAIDFIARCTLSWANLACGLLAGVFAYLSFATAIALVPAAILLLILREDQSRMRRAVGAVLWGGCGLAAYAFTRKYNAAEIPASPSLVLSVHYALNFLGGGIGRFATDAAPLLALAALGSGAWAFLRSVDRRKSLPWLGFFVFAIVCAFVIAVARAADNGAQHAFVTRYVSISSLFWLGWLGLIALADLRSSSARRFGKIAVAVVVLFAAVNTVQMTRKAARVASETRTIATAIRTTWPNIDAQLLRSLYFDQPELTMSRLAALKALGFPPFDVPPPATDETK